MIITGGRELARYVTLNAPGYTYYTIMNEFEKSHIQLVNETDFEFIDISTEEKRVYRFQNEEYVTINKPIKLHVSSSGGHRVFDAYGNSHYIPSGWIHLKWVAKEGEANFVK